MGQRKRWRTVVLTGICLAFLGCQDRHDTVAPLEMPGVQFLIAPDDEGGGGSGPVPPEEAPQYASESEIPPEYWSSSIYGVRDDVKWYGASVEGYGEMTYVGNPCPDRQRSRRSA